GQVQEAQDLSDKALALNPDYAPIYQNFGSIMLNNGRADEAVMFQRKSLKIKKSDSAYSCLFFAMNLIPSFSQKDIFDESARWGQVLSQRFIRKKHGHLNSSLPDRKIRIGYVSGDFKQHPVTFHLKPVLASHNKQNTEIYLYNSFPHADRLTEELANYADIYRDISSLSDDKLEQLIRMDCIDILVDLAGHTAFHRLGLFARCVAPVQVSWLGYFNTTGLRSIDYLISDSVTIPPSEDKYFTEQVIRLPDCRFCYQPMPNAPPVATTPVLLNGYITFGSFNAIHKITSEVIALWSRLLLVLPHSRIVLKSLTFKDEIIKNDFIKKFTYYGITANRIELRPRSSYSDMLNEYADIDIALDTFPYNGGATTCEALWMGVPVVTLECGTPISRQSKAFLYTIGYPEWVASNADEYVEKIQRLTRNVKDLQLIRAGLRKKMADSPLCDGLKFTRHLETAYRQMWHRWCSETLPIKSFRQFNTDELYAAGYSNLVDGDIHQAYKLFNRILRRCHGHILALNGIGKTFEKLGNYPSAVKSFKKAIRLDPSYFNSFFNLGFLSLYSENIKEAKKNFLLALALSPNHVETLINLSITNRLLGRLHEAQLYCETALDIFPEHVGALGCLAFLSRDQGDIPRSIEILKRVMVLEPDNVEILSAIMSYMIYIYDTDQKEIFEISKRIGSAFDRIAPTTPVFSISPEVRQHLRIGFVSSDFCHHPVGLLLVALFKEF
ncbi:MAG: tetratricopeptide repeat protein, partial [Desulfuromonadales bacterium]